MASSIENLNTNGTYIGTLNADGSAPKSRLASAVQAEEVYWQLWYRYNYGRGRINAKVQGAINGNAPFEQSKLDAEGLGWMSNVNFRLLESDVNSAQIPLYMLFADVEQYIQVQTEVPNVSPEDNLVYGKIIGEEHKNLCDKWRYFDYYMQLAISNMVKYGLGQIYFPNKEDFRFKAAPMGNVFVPDETTQNLDEMSLMYIYYEWEVSELYRMIMADGAEEAGWDVEHVKSILVNICNEFSGFTRYRSWEYWEQKIREGDIYWSQITPKVRTAWGYVKEFTGKITCFLIVSNRSGGQGKFLYRVEEEYDNWSEIIHPMFYEIGNGNWNGVKGLGIKAYNFRDAQNRLKNRLLDAAFIGSQVMLTVPDEKTAANLELQQLGPLAILPNTVTFQQMPMAGVLDKPMMVDRSLEQTLQSNIGGLRQNITDPTTAQPVSATEANINATYTSQLTQAQQTLYLRQLDDLYTEQMRRLAKPLRVPAKIYPYNDWELLAKEFKDRCHARGVPELAFKHIKKVCATRTIGRGSEYFKQQLSGQVYATLRQDPNVPQKVVVTHLRNMLANLTGEEYLNMIWPIQINAQSAVEDNSKAQDENAGMIQGVPPIWTDEQNNMAHYQTHMQFAMPMLQNLQQAIQQSQQQSGQQQGINSQVLQGMQQYLTFAQVALPHIQQHLNGLRATMKGQQFQQIWNAFEQLQSGTNQIVQQFQAGQRAAQQQALQQQQQTQQALSDQALKAQKIHAETQLKAVETHAKIQRENALAGADIQRNSAKTRQELAVNDVKTAQTVRQNRMKNKEQQNVQT